MVRIFCLMIAVTALAACTTANMQTGDALSNNEGIVITTCKTPNTISRVVNVFPENYKPGFGSKMPPMLKCTQDGVLAVVKFESGKYYVGATQDFTKFKHLPHFTVQPNKVTYIGDLRIAVKETNIVTGLLVGFDQPKIKFSIVDESEATISSFKEQYPEIASKYEIVSSIAKK